MSKSVSLYLLSACPYQLMCGGLPPRTGGGGEGCRLLNNPLHTRSPALKMVSGKRLYVARFFGHFCLVFLSSPSLKPVGKTPTDLGGATTVSLRLVGILAAGSNRSCLSLLFVGRSVLASATLATCYGVDWGDDRKPNVSTDMVLGFVPHPTLWSTA